MEKHEEQNIQALVDSLPAANRVEAERNHRYVEAVRQISPKLLPETVAHPYREHITSGPAAFTDLLHRLEGTSDEDELTAIIDAITRIIEMSYATQEVTEVLWKLLGSESERVSSISARALAVARNWEWLQIQHAHLGSDNPLHVHTAAMLLGFGRHAEAVPDLLALLNRDRLSIADAIIWALGEIGSPTALPPLHALLDAGILSIQVLDAIGKIGSFESVDHLLPILEIGTAPEREMAAHALGTIALWRNDLPKQLTERTRKALRHVIDHDDSKVARYHAVVAHTRWGERLPEKHVMTALGAPLLDKDLDSMSKFFSKRSKPS